jgi:hypothetical protein
MHSGVPGDISQIGDLLHDLVGQVGGNPSKEEDNEGYKDKGAIGCPGEQVGCWVKGGEWLGLVPGGQGVRWVPPVVDFQCGTAGGPGEDWRQKCGGEDDLGTWIR